MRPSHFKKDENQVKEFRETLTKTIKTLEAIHPTINQLGKNMLLE